MTDQHLAFIIEDDFDASQIFTKALEVQGLKTECIHDGEKALERLRTAVPFIIVLDLHLPNVDGTEILAWVRSMPALKETLVIVVTADARMGETLEDKADLVLLKPATFTQIRDFTARLISRKLRLIAEAEEAANAAAAVSAEAPAAEAAPLTESAAIVEAPSAEVIAPALEIKPAEPVSPAVEAAISVQDMVGAAADQKESGSVAASMA